MTKLRLFLAFSLLVCWQAFGQNAALLPWGEQPFLLNNGGIAANGFIYTYFTGTTNPAPSYTDSTAGTQNTNPIQLNASGFPQTAGGTQIALWLAATNAYRICLQNAAHVQQWCLDGVKGGNGSLMGISSYSGNTTVLAPSFSFLECTGGSLGITLTLPSAAVNSGLNYWVEKTDSAAGACTLTDAASANFLSTAGTSSTYAIGQQGLAVLVISDGTNWDVVGAGQSYLQMRTGSDLTITNAFQTVVSFFVPASVNRAIHCDFVTTLQTNTVFTVRVTGTANVTNYTEWGTFWTTSSAATNPAVQHGTVLPSTSIAAASAGGIVLLPQTFNFAFENAATAQIVGVQIEDSNGNNSAVLSRGSNCIISGN